MTNETSHASMGVTLRPVEPEDESFLVAVYASTRAQELAMVPWDEAQKQAFLRMQFAAQQASYANQFPLAQHQLILSHGEPVGRLYVAREKEMIRILDITLLPQYRSAGIGTPLIKDLINEAMETSRPLQIYVESFNPSLRLFERLGFTKIEEESFNLLLEWRAVESK
jgi:ribosomal protein S18 acetylase RimI-like enzyme